MKTHRKVALELLTRPRARLRWQKGLERAVLIEGEAGETGAVTALAFNLEGNARRTIETVVRSDQRTSLHVAQVTGEDTFHLYYGFISVRKGYIRVSLNIEFAPGSSLGFMKGFFDKKMKTLATEHLDELKMYVDNRNVKRKIRRETIKAITAAQS